MTHSDAIFEINTVFAGNTSPRIVQLSFEMPYHGWCLLQQSKKWEDFLAVLADAQKG